MTDKFGNKTENELKERVKELNCLFEVAQLSGDSSLSESDYLQAVLELIPPAWQYPAITCARIIIGKQKYKTPGFKATKYQLKVNIKIDNDLSGAIEVYYKEKRPELDNGPFLKEERRLLNAIAVEITKALQSNQYKRALQESEKRYRTTFENSRTAIVLIEKDGTLSLVNRMFSKFSGYEIHEIENKKKWMDFVVKEDLEYMQKQHDTRRENREKASTEYEFRFLDRYNKIRYIHLFIDMIPGTDRSVASLIDITNSKIAENNLRHANQNLEITLDSIGDAVIVTDNHGYINRMNPVAEKLTGYKFEEVKNRLAGDILKIYNTFTSEKAVNPVNEVLSTNQKTELANHTKIITKSGKEFQISDSAAPIKDPEGKTYGVVMVFRDVTEKYIQREKLKTSEARFRKTLNTMMEGCQIIDREWRYVYLNDVALKHGQKSREELTGTRMMDAYPGIENQPLFEKLQKCMNDRVTLHFENEFKYTDGSSGSFSLSIQLSEEGIYIFSLDITKHKKVLDSLTKSEAKYRHLFETMDQGVIYQNSKGQIISANPAAEKILGREFSQLKNLTSDEPIWKSIDEDYNPLPGDKHPAMQALKNGKTIKNFVQGVYNPKVKAYKWLLVSSIPMFKKGQSKPYQIFSTFSDISKMKKSEKELRDSEERYRLIVENQSELVVKVNSDGEFLFVSPSYYKLFGIKPDDVIGQKYIPLVPEDEQARISKAMQKLYVPPHTAYLEHRAKTINGWRWFAWSDKALLDENGNVSEIIGVGRDITQQKETEIELHNLKDNLEIEVEKKTKELNERIEILERIQEATIEREHRIKELNDEIKKLKHENL